MTTSIRSRTPLPSRVWSYQRCSEILPYRCAGEDMPVSISLLSGASTRRNRRRPSATMDIRRLPPRSWSRFRTLPTIQYP